MSISVKRIGAVLAAAILACTPLVGCGSDSNTDLNTVVSEVTSAVIRDTATPDGALMTRLDALISGDISGLPLFDPTQLEQVNISQTQIEEIISSFFGKNEYHVGNVTVVDDTQAQVNISGKAVNMSKLLPVVMGQYMANYTEYAVNHDVQNTDNQPAVREAMITMFADAAREKQAAAALNDVSATITMKKNGDTWDVDTSEETNANALVELVTGSTREELAQGIGNLLGSFGALS